MSTTTLTRDNARFDHAFDFNLTPVYSNCENASDISGAELKRRFIAAIKAIDDEAFLQHAHCFDTIPLREGD